MSPCLDAAGRSADGRMPATPAPMLTVDTLAELLGVSARHVRRLVDAGRAPQPVRLGRSCRWPRAAVETWIAAGCPKIRTVRAGGAK
jgi:excisionase family DNA binding protein